MALENHRQGKIHGARWGPCALYRVFHQEDRAAQRRNSGRRWRNEWLEGEAHPPRDDRMPPTIVRHVRHGDVAVARTAEAARGNRQRSAPFCNAPTVGTDEDAAEGWYNDEQL